MANRDRTSGEDHTTTPKLAGRHDDPVGRHADHAVSDVRPVDHLLADVTRPSVAIALRSHRASRLTTLAGCGPAEKRHILTVGTLATAGLIVPRGFFERTAPVCTATGEAPITNSEAA